MSIKSRGLIESGTDCRFVFSLACLPKNSVVKKMKDGIVTYATKIKVPKNIKSGMFILDKNIKLFVDKEKMKIPILVCDTKKDIIISLNAMIKYIKENNL